MDPAPPGYHILNTEHLNQIRAWMDTDPSKFIVTKYGRMIHAEDIQQFQKGRYANIKLQHKMVKILNFYMNLLVDPKHRNENGKLCAAGSQFYDYLFKGSVDEATLSIDSLHILKCDKVFITVAHNNRCKLAVIYPDEREIICYDPHSIDNEILLHKLEDYIKTDFQKRHVTEFDMSKWRMSCATNIPNQLNDHESGIFVCAYAESLSRNQRNFMFTHKHIENFRNRIAYEIGTGKMLD